jgi:signal transduction histidine kinase/DNA-binding response OmpR family regulator
MTLDLPVTIFVSGSEQTAELLAGLFPGDEPSAALARATDWSATSMGDPSTWPEEIRAAIRTVLPSKIPMLLWVGPDLVQIYNEALRPVLGTKHPQAMGQPAAECWSEVWGELDHLTRRVYEESESTYADRLLLFLDRHGYTEETYWTFSYSPIRDAHDQVVGIFVATTDHSTATIEARRLDTVHALAVVSSAELGSPREVCEHALSIMSGNRRALPLAAVYLRNAADGSLVLAARYGVEPSERSLPHRIPATVEHPYAAVAAQRRKALLAFGPDDDLRASPGPLGPLLPHDAMVLPLDGAPGEPPAGVLVLGLNPYRRLDDSYSAFLDLITRQVSTLLADARATEDERERAATLSELDSSKTKFFQNVSHEFRTPLTIAMAATRELRTHELPAAYEPHVDAVERAVSRLNRLVDALLEFARAESGTLVPVVQALDLSSFTRDLVSMFRSAIENSGLTLQVDVAETGTAWVDQEAWAKVVVNLVSNAFKFTQDGGIAVSLRRSGDDVELAVTDTGCGIPRDERELVFERFRQVGRESRPGVPGAGIGLALVADLVRANGGEVSLDSELGRGSTFSVRLPVGAPTGAAAHPKPGMPVPHPTSAAWDDGLVPARARAVAGPDLSITDPTPIVPVIAGGARLLLVEDDADLRGYLTRLLSSDRWDVTAVADVPSALAVEHVPELILTDIMMPGQSGLDLVRLVRQDERMAQVPIVLLSARAGSSAAAEGLAAGADDYVVKPFESVELLSRLRVHHELAQQRARALDQAEARANTLTLALRTNRRIGMAIGILMAARGVTSEEAFDLLRRRSSNRNIKLRDVAEDVLLTGELAND